MIDIFTDVVAVVAGNSGGAFQNSLGAMRPQIGNNMFSVQQQQQQQQQIRSPQQQQQQQQQHLNNSLLRQALMQKTAAQQEHQLYQQQVLNSGGVTSAPLSVSGGGGYPQDIDLNTDFTDLSCDVDQIISQELSYGGPLDFSDDPTTVGSPGRGGGPGGGGGGGPQAPPLDLSPAAGLALNNQQGQGQQGGDNIFNSVQS